MTSNPRIVFFGTPTFAVPSLQKLTQTELRPLAVVTQPARPVGRKALSTASPVQAAAAQLGIPVQTPGSLTDRAFLSWFKAQRPDLAVLIAYGKILPADVLAIPRLGFVNVHPSLLPRHRGASPVAGALLEGDVETGISIMQLDSQLDHGPVYAQVGTSIPEGSTRDSLLTSLAEQGADLLVQTLPKILAGSLTPTPQDHDQATFTKILKRTDGDIDWSQTATHIERMVRAYSSWPGTYTCLGDKRVKILQAQLADKPELPPGRVATLDGRLFIGTAMQALEVTRLQASGKKPQTAKDFINGHTDLSGATVVPCHEQTAA